MRFAEVGHVHAGAGRIDIDTRRLVEQQGNRVKRLGIGARQQLDSLVFDLELRLLDYNAIDRDPASFDIQLCLSA
ncbi:hypothetical protein D3C73_1334510 [compost metagenome]